MIGPIASATVIIPSSDAFPAQPDFVSSLRGKEVQSCTLGWATPFELYVGRGVSRQTLHPLSKPVIEVPVETKTDAIRVIIAKVGLDGHDRGVKIVARALRDAGMDVIYTGLHRTAEEVVDAAVQEDVDVLGVSLLSGAHMTIFPKILQLLKNKGADDILVVGGGVMPDEDATALKKMGVKEVLLQDTPPEMIVSTIRRLVAERGPK